MYCVDIRKYIQKKYIYIKNIKNYKSELYKKYCTYNTKDNNLFEKFAFYNNNFDNKKSVDKELVTLSKEDINKILNNK